MEMEDGPKILADKQIHGFIEIEGNGNLKENLVKDEPGGPKRNIEDLKNEEETLKAQLERLKRDNFSLKMTISAWQDTLARKLEEFKEADSKLNQVYDDVWSERENFCSKAEAFVQERGILSEWWEAQMKFVSDLDYLEKKREEDDVHQQEIERLKKEVEELKKEIEGLERFSPTGDLSRVSSSDTMEVSPEVPPEGSVRKKKVRFLEDLPEIEECQEEIPDPGNDLFSMVDVEKVRRANRGRNRCKLFPRGRPCTS